MWIAFRLIQNTPYYLFSKNAGDLHLGGVLLLSGVKSFSKNGRKPHLNKVFNEHKKLFEEHLGTMFLPS